jgi:hypothetical protein
LAMNSGLCQRKAVVFGPSAYFELLIGRTRVPNPLAGTRRKARTSGSNVAGQIAGRSKNRSTDEFWLVVAGKRMVGRSAVRQFLGILRLIPLPGPGGIPSAGSTPWLDLRSIKII